MRQAGYAAGGVCGARRLWTFCRTFHMAGRTQVWTIKTTKKEVGALLHLDTHGHLPISDLAVEVTMTLALLHRGVGGHYAVPRSKQFYRL